MEAKRAAVNTTPALVDDPGVEVACDPNSYACASGLQSDRDPHLPPSFLKNPTSIKQTARTFFAKPNLLKNVAHD